MENHLLNMKGILSKETSDFKQGLEGGGGGSGSRITG